MISRTALPGHADWREEAAAAACSPAAAAERLAQPEVALTGRVAHELFPTRIPEEWLVNGVDPAVLRQVLPDPREAEVRDGFVIDPVGDRAAMPEPGVLHKYDGRVLLIATGACVVNCRYCFRRHFPYGDALASRNDWQGAVRYIAARPDISEVILSGGDPLTLTTRRLAVLSARLADIPHVRRLRIHSRTPVVLPARVDDELLAWLMGSAIPVTMVLHVNHAGELTPRARAALVRLRSSGVMLLNQAVLLAGVNDSVEVLGTLSEELYDAGVLPYYLHLLDPVAGAAHFDVAEGIARELHASLRDRLPGYLIPRLVREVAGDPSKRPIEP